MNFKVYTQHLLAGPKGNSYLLLSQESNCFLRQSQGCIEVELIIPEGLVICCEAQQHM